MLNIDFKEHNREVKAMWEAFYRGEAYRMPMILGVNPRYLLLNRELNPKNITYREYTGDPEIMLQIQLEFSHYMAMNVLSDREMGLPEKGWNLSIDFQNCGEAAWLGCPVRYIDGNVPSVDAFLREDNKNELFERGIPDPFSGLMAKVKEYYETMTPKLPGMSYMGAPVKSFSPSQTLWCDGPFTVACDLRGTTELCMDIYADPEYARELLSFVTDALIAKIKAWRKYLGEPEKSEGLWFADDSVALLSTEMHEEIVLPCHQKLTRELSREGYTHSIHLCGDATRHFKTLVEKLNVACFDTGFPVRHGALVAELGPDITVQGGPHIEFLRTKTPEEIMAETKRIIDEVKPLTRRFILREGNNVAPGTPAENLNAMYEACRKFGNYTENANEN